MTANNNKLRGLLPLLAVLGLAQGLTAQADAQTVYKSVDENGTVAYTDRPPANAPAETVQGLDIDYTDRQLIAAQNDEFAKQSSAEQVADGIRDEQTAEETAMRAAAEEKRLANCKIARERLAKYSEAHRLYRELPEGGREYLSDSELDSARAKAARSVDEWCG